MEKYGAILIALVMTAPLAQAKRKKAPKALSPVTVELENACKSDLTVKLGAVEVKLATGQKSGAQTLQGKEDWSYPLHLTGAKTSDLGLLAMEPGGSYSVRLAACRAGAADIYTSSHAALPATASPHAAAQVRYRARQNRAFEYASGKIRRFKTLAVGMTSYQDVPAGEHGFRFRLRAAKRGPILKMLNAKAQLEAGHKYLIEANVVGTEILFKIEDEGLVSTKG